MKRELLVSAGIFKLQIFLTFENKLQFTSMFISKLITKIKSQKAKISNLESKLRKIQENEVRHKTKRYAFLQVDFEKRGIKLVNLNSEIFAFSIHQNQEYHEITRFFKWPLKEVKCKICIFGVDLVFYMRIEKMPPASKTCSVEPGVPKLGANRLQVHSDRSIDETLKKEFLFRFTQHTLQYKMNKSTELRIQSSGKEFTGRRIRDGLSVISFDGVQNPQNLFQFESEEVGPLQRHEPTIKTDLRTESEWFGFIPSKEVTCEKGSHDFCLEQVQSKNAEVSSKMELKKRSFKEMESQGYTNLSKEKSVSHHSPTFKLNPPKIIGIPTIKHNCSIENKKVNKGIEGKNKEIHCVICHEYKNSIRGVLDCDHSYCFDCINKWLKNSVTCPICKIQPRLIRRFQENKFIRSEFTRPSRDIRFGLPLHVRGRNRWVVHEMGSENEGVDFSCIKCRQMGDISTMVQCIRCQVKACHMDCLWHDSRELPNYQWFCDDCVRSRPNPTSYSRKTIYPLPH